MSRWGATKDFYANGLTSGCRVPKEKGWRQDLPVSSVTRILRYVQNGLFGSFLTTKVTAQLHPIFCLL